MLSRLALIAIVTSFVSSANAKPNCKKLTEATFFQGALASGLLNHQASIEDKASFLYERSTGKYKGTRVSTERQKEIATEIVSVKLTRNEVANAYLVADFFYAQCSVDQERLRYERLTNAAIEDLHVCWKKYTLKNEKRRKKCAKEIMVTSE